MKKKPEMSVETVWFQLEVRAMKFSGEGQGNFNERIKNEIKDRLSDVTVIVKVMDRTIRVAGD